MREGQWDITVQKTGYIREAGKSMVLQAKLGRDPVIIVVLGANSSANRVSDVRTLGNIVKQTQL